MTSPVGGGLSDKCLGLSGVQAKFLITTRDVIYPKEVFLLTRESCKVIIGKGRENSFFFLSFHLNKYEESDLGNNEFLNRGNKLLISHGWINYLFKQISSFHFYSSPTPL